jgi:hypothetical protein
VFDLACGGRMDVYRFDIESMRDLVGSIRGRRQAGQISQPHESTQSQDPHRRPLDPLVYHMFSSVGRMER